MYFEFLAISGFQETRGELTKFLLLIFYQVYKKCKDAPDTYRALSDHVGVLHNVLRDIMVYLEEEEVPTGDRRMASLITAREGCRTTLDEVEEFLDKYSSLGKNQKRLIELLKFITKDVDSLKGKLDGNTNLLQISLTSLTK
ncbi:hypothetical protein EJ08DRAFT_497514 [Tothia fuscella]|uniref:Uncharacterized protein n=1 Tax=Tothia fuscella TaxID=1048955 RepID=A0A9P4P009_9PEZI|nr:hypothetical protein EJ08DRAFT_497514 [Tothia fuscella]